MGLPKVLLITCQRVWLQLILFIEKNSASDNNNSGGASKQEKEVIIFNPKRGKGKSGTIVNIKTKLLLLRSKQRKGK